MALGQSTSRTSASKASSPREQAIALLARREYSRAELAARLSAKGVEASAIESTLDALAAEGLQSDTRFAEVFVRSRIARGQGPMKMRADIAQRGVAETLLAEALEAESPDWRVLACEVLAKRFDGPGATPGERSKRERFLAGRGFTFDQVRHAMRAAWRGEAHE